MSELGLVEPTHDDYVRLFEPLAAMQARHGELSRVGPASRSQAAIDSRSKVGQMAWHLSLPAAAIGVDHLVAWANLRVRAGSQPPFSHFTLIRAAIEGCAVARWLCDPAVTAAVRVQRAAGVQLEDYEQRLRFENRTGSGLVKPTGSGRTAAQRLAGLKKLLASHKVTALQMPPTTVLFGRYAPFDDRPIGGEGLYRLMAGVIHSKVWSLQAVTDLSDVVDLGEGSRPMKVEANAEFAFVATLIAMRIALDALADIERYAAPPKSSS